MSGKQTRERIVEVWLRAGPDNSFQFLHLGAKEGDPGTVAVYTRDVHASPTSTEAIGKQYGHTTVIQGNSFNNKPFVAAGQYTCVLPGGKIQFGGILEGQTSQTIPVLGGTGEFEGARGTITFGEDLLEHFHLILDAEELQESRGQAQVSSSDKASGPSVTAPSFSGKFKVRLQDDMLKAMQAVRKATDVEGARIRPATIQLLHTAIEQDEAEAGAGLDSMQIETIINKLLSKSRQSIDKFEAEGRADLAAKEKEVLAILTAYLPDTTERP